MAARSGLLHDFCLYDFREKPPTNSFWEAWIITMTDKGCTSVECCNICIALERGRR